MKYTFFVFSDVHGEYDALITSLKEAGYDEFNPKHRLISLGDNFDRGPNSLKVFNFLQKTNAICVKGNHDVMFQEYLEKGMDGEFVLFNIIHNGLGATIKSFAQGLVPFDDNQLSVAQLDLVRSKSSSCKSALNWLHSLPLYFETKNCIFTHAGIDPRLSNWKETPEDVMLWDIEYSHKNCPNTMKKVFIGHHHAFRVRQNGEAAGYKETNINDMRCYGNTDEHRPYIYRNKVAIDGCTNYTKKVNVVVFEDEMLPDPKIEREVENSGVEPPIYTTVSGTAGFTYNFGGANIENFYDYYNDGTITQAAYTTTRR